VAITIDGWAFRAHAQAAPAPSAGCLLGPAALRERSGEPTSARSTGEVRPHAGAVPMAAMTPTADNLDPVRVRCWSPPV
jgi:hypothetical protein